MENELYEVLVCGGAYILNKGAFLRISIIVILGLFDPLAGYS